MDKVSRILYLVAGIVNAVVEVFATLVLLCLLDNYTHWNLAEKIPWVGIETEVINGSNSTSIILMTIFLLAFSFVLYFLGVKGRKNLKNHTHRLPSHIFTLIISIYYFYTGFSYVILLSSSSIVTYSLMGGAGLYFLSGLFGIIGHNR